MAIVKPKVLIVDDAPTIRQQMLSFLENDFDCLLAVDGREGFALALQHRPAAIVSDVEMPEVSGFELLTMLRNNSATETIPVIMCTTVTSIEIVNECRARGCSGYVLKPVNGDYLRAKLRQLLHVKG